MKSPRVFDLALLSRDSLRAAVSHRSRSFRNTCTATAAYRCFLVPTPRQTDDARYFAEGNTPIGVVADHVKKRDASRRVGASVREREKRERASEREVFAPRREPATLPAKPQSHARACSTETRACSSKRNCSVRVKLAFARTTHAPRRSISRIARIGRAGETINSGHATSSDEITPRIARARDSS